MIVRTHPMASQRSHLPSTLITPNLRFTIVSQMKQPPGTRPPSSTRSPKPAFPSSPSPSTAIAIPARSKTFNGRPRGAGRASFRPDRIRAYPLGDTEPTRSSCALRDALEELAFHYLETTHDGWENGDGANGEFTFDTTTRSITLAYNERFTDSIYSEHEF